MQVLERHHRCYRSSVMDATTRLEKLRRKQEQLTATLRAMEVQVVTKKRKAITRAKIMVGGVVVSMPLDEREALLSMILGRMTERDRQFVHQCLFEGGSNESPREPGASKEG